MPCSATDVEFDDTSIIVTLDDGRKLRAPLSWFPILRSATPQQRANVRISPSGSGLHWDEIDEDLSVEQLRHRLGDISAPEPPTD
jgi:hypothetical protein